MSALAGTSADVYITSGVSVAISNLVLTDSGDHTNYTTPALERYLDDSVVYEVDTSPDGTTWTPAATTAYTIQYVGGVVTFTSANAAGTQVRLHTGAYVPVSQCGQAHEWTLDPQVALVDTTSFGQTWKQFTPVMKDATIKISRYWLDSFFLTNMGDKLVVALYTDQPNNKRFACFAFLKQDSVKNLLAGVMEEDLSFTASGPVFFLTVA